MNTSIGILRNFYGVCNFDAGLHPIYFSIKYKMISHTFKAYN